MHRASGPGLGRLTAALVETLLFPVNEVAQPVASIAAHAGVSRPAPSGGPCGQSLGRDLQALRDLLGAEPGFAESSLRPGMGMLSSGVAGIAR